MLFLLVREDTNWMYNLHYKYTIIPETNSYSYNTHIYIEELQSRHYSILLLIVDPTQLSSISPHAEAAKHNTHPLLQISRRKERTHFSTERNISNMI